MKGLHGIQRLKPTDFVLRNKKNEKQNKTKRGKTYCHDATFNKKKLFVTSVMILLSSGALLKGWNSISNTKLS